jgi:hypothetical protein
MNDQADDLDQTDEDFLSCTVSDETLEAAAGASKAASSSNWPCGTLLGIPCQPA